MSRRPTIPFNVNNAADATFAAIAAVTGKSALVRKLILVNNHSTAETFTIKWASATVFGPFKLAANGGAFVMDFDDDALKGPVNTALNITKGNASSDATCFGTVEFE